MTEQTEDRHLRLVASHDVLPADPVYDGELVYDTLVRTADAFMTWWHRSRRVPQAVKSRASARQAARDGLTQIRE